MQLRGIEAPLLTPNEAQIVSARGDLALARVNLEKLKIRAPIDGTVLQININPGELAAPSALAAAGVDRQSFDAERARRIG